MLIDRVTEEGITHLVHAFYAKVRADAELGPIFDRVIRDNWDKHLATMCEFWSSVMLTSGRYKGAPVPAHLRIKDITPSLFDRWLELFGETCDDLFETGIADAFRLKAQRIAESLKLALFFRLVRTSVGAAS
jgi:hemoglobin